MNLYKKIHFVLIYFVVALILSCQSAEKPVENTAIAENNEAIKQEEIIPNLTIEERLKSINKDLHLAKEELDLQDKYDCCISPACDWCLLHEGSCKCRENLRAEKAVCPGCGLGWHNGKGKLRGIKASQVKWDISHEHAKSEHKH